MTKREELGKLMTDFANANYKCGNHVQYSREQYFEIWNHAVECEAKLLDFLEPYLPKD